MFDQEATKLEPHVDTIREGVFMLSTAISVTHCYLGHQEPDEERVFRQAILNQTLADFNAMMISYRDRRPSCSSCRSIIRP